ncbi:MAG: glucuronate isomerase [Chloroflexota bacterium]
MSIETPNHPTNQRGRYFDSESHQQKMALHLYDLVADLPLICPHGHVDPSLFSNPDVHFDAPAQLLIVPDHYVVRMLYSQGIPMEQLGIPRQDAIPNQSNPLIASDEEIWQTFADNFYLFRGTPTGMWIRDELSQVFGIHEKLNSENGPAIYQMLKERLASPEFQPRQLFERFKIEVLCTTDPATSTLEHHQAIRDSHWRGDIRPTFRPDAIINLDAPGWQQEVDLLGDRVGKEIGSYRDLIQALEERRSFFKEKGATATDHSSLTPFTERLSEQEAEQIWQRGLRGEADESDARQFTGHMYMEMARMSVEDGLVMQLHTGTVRNHNRPLFERYGPDMGADIPIANEFTQNLRPLLNEFGNHPNLTLILFMLDESTLSRELAPLAGHYPALRLGPPWWFFDSWNGMMRFRELVSEAAGLYNTVGFNDDTRAFPSIPIRHDLARRVDANWIANLVVRNVIDLEDGEEMIQAAAYSLAKSAYKL